MSRRAYRRQITPVDATARAMAPLIEGLERRVMLAAAPSAPAIAIVVASPALTADVAVTAIAPVTDLSVTSIGDQAVNLAWTNPADPLFDGVVILREEGSAPDAAPTDGNIYTVGDWVGSAQVGFKGNGTVFHDANLTNGSIYYYALYAYTTSNEFSATPATISATPVALPDAPMNLQASDGTSADDVQLTWTVTPSADSYQVWRNTSDDSTTADYIDDATYTTYADTTADPGVSYYYWVKAVNAAGTSDFGASDSGYRADVPAAPSEVVASDGTGSSVQITWTASPGAESYDLWRNTSDDSSTALQLNGDPVTDTSYEDATAETGVTYYYWVTATNVAGTSDFSASDSGYSLALPDVPTDVQASDGEYLTGVLISWSASAGADFYNIFRATSPNEIGGYLGATDGDTLSYFDTTAAPGTTYWYCVLAGNSAGSLDFSAADSGFCSLPDSTPPAPITGATAAPADAQVTMVWTNPSDSDLAGVLIIRWNGPIPADFLPTTNTFYHAADTIGATGVVVLAGSGTTFTDTALSNGTAYRYSLYSFDRLRNYGTAVTVAATPASAAAFATLDPTTGVLRLDGTDQADTLSLTISGDSLLATRGPDTISFAVESVYRAAIYGLAGDDTISIGAGVSSVSITVFGGSGNDTITGSAGNDILRGQAGSDLVIGGGGDDTLLGQGGNDELRGGGGKDRLTGGPGYDTLLGQRGSDTLMGGNGSDLLLGGMGADMVYDRDGARDTVMGGPGQDIASGDALLDLVDAESLLA